MLLEGAVQIARVQPHDDQGCDKARERVFPQTAFFDCVIHERAMMTNSEDYLWSVPDELGRRSSKMLDL